MRKLYSFLFGMFIPWHLYAQSGDFFIKNTAIYIDEIVNLQGDWIDQLGGKPSVDEELCFLNRQEYELSLSLGSDLQTAVINFKENVDTHLDANGATIGNLQLQFLKRRRSGWRAYFQKRGIRYVKPLSKYLY